MILCCEKFDVCAITNRDKFVGIQDSGIASGYQNRGWPLSGGLSYYLVKGVEVTRKIFKRKKRRPL